MRSMWKGAISFGLVMIPVKLYAATEQKDIAFRQVHREDGGRIRFKRVCSVDGEEVPYEDVAKGYELPTGEMIILTEEDMAELPLSSSKSIEVLNFAPVDQLDPILFNRSYYVEPETAGVRAYAPETACWCWRRCCGRTRSAPPTSVSWMRTSRCAPRNCGWRPR
jgi:DNA end-binding protein Ku